MTTMIAVQKLVKHYDGGLVQALRGVSFEVVRGSVCALTGVSGCGKSTLLHLIGGLDRATSGRIIVAGRELSQWVPASLYRLCTVGFVFQLHNLLPHLSLVENVEIPMLAVRGMLRKERRHKALSLLEEVGLLDRAAFPPTRVSGGERQRAAMARALANDPEIILADEPTGSVDSQSADQILAALLRRCRHDNITVLIATHNHEVAARADCILRLQDGLVISD